MDKRVPAELELRLILDNSSTRGTAEVKAWLAAHPRVHLHRMPTSASWLNAVEGGFSVQRVSIACVGGARRVD